MLLSQGENALTIIISQAHNFINCRRKKKLRELQLLYLLAYLVFEQRLKNVIELNV